MYSIQFVYCTTFPHANCLRAMLEADGYVAIAATIDLQRQREHVVIATAPLHYPYAMRGIAELFSRVGPDGSGGLACIEKQKGPAVPTLPPAIPEELRGPCRDRLCAALKATVALVERCVPPLDTGCHDPGDEDGKPDTRNDF